MMDPERLCHPERPHYAKGLCKSCYGTSKKLRDKYDISMTQWRLMYDRQKGICPICLKELPGLEDLKGRRAASVDHDHKTKRVRGLTCGICNKYKIGTHTKETAERLWKYLSSGFDGRTLIEIRKENE